MYNSYMKVREFANELSSLMDTHNYIGYQLIPSLDGDPRKIIWKKPTANSQVEVECSDALAYNLTVLDFKDFTEFVDFVDKYYSKCKYAGWMDMWDDYIYYKSLDSE